MGDWNHCTHEQQRALTGGDDAIAVVLHRADSRGAHGGGGGGDHDECADDDERAAERIHLQTYCHLSCDYGNEDDEDDVEETRGSSDRGALCPPAFCVRDERSSREGGAREGNARGAQTTVQRHISSYSPADVTCIRLWEQQEKSPSS